ncbi:hypothetical protein M885DRAFT_522229 [Pelagophyceae sp. CCMP2097]|nr:hypothetical protein M885DRAFT_522229 [Pelagophyceae sp. CCMP2097]
MRTFATVLGLCAYASGLSASVPQTKAAVGRRDFATAFGTASVSALGLPLAARADDLTALPSGLKYKIVKEDKNGKVPKIGDLIAVRFRASYNGNVFDDLFATEEPLYYRVGGGTLIKGIDEAINMMHLGDTWTLAVPGDLAFGAKGRPASAGKPRIPANAQIDVELAFVGFPGFEGDLIDSL